MSAIRNQHDQNLIDKIDEFGWFCLTVAPQRDDPDQGPIFAYSIGFETSLLQPNVILFGLGSKVMHGMLSMVFNAVRQGRRLSDRSRWTEPLEGYECELRSVHRTNCIPEYFGYGLWYHEQYLGRREPFTAYQLFWPGVKDRLLPWESGSHEIVRAAQPRLDLQQGTQ